MMTVSTLKTLTAACVFALTGFAAISAHATDYNDSAKSSVTVSKNNRGQTIYTVQNVAYEIAHTYTNGDASPILFKKITREISTEGVDGSSSQLAVEARASSHGTFDKVLYRITENAHDAAFIDDGLYLTWQYGCCDSTTSFHAFNAVTGKLLLAYDDRTGSAEGNHVPPFIVDVPNSKPSLMRYLGILTDTATRDFKPGQTPDHLTKVAVLSYASPEGLIQRYAIYSRVPQNYAMATSADIVDNTGVGKNEVRGNRLTLWTSDGLSDAKQALRGFGVKLTFEAETKTEMTIVISDDRIDLASTRVPEGFRLIAE